MGQTAEKLKIDTATESERHPNRGASDQHLTRTESEHMAPLNNLKP